MTDKLHMQHLYNAVHTKPKLVLLFPFLLTDVTEPISTLTAVTHMSTQNLKFDEQLTVSKAHNILWQMQMYRGAVSP